MKLRPRPGRRALAETSRNPDRKRKASADGLVACPAKTRKMDKSIPTVTPRGRGRPRKDQKPSIDPEFALPLRPAYVPVLGSIPTLPPSSSSASPRKSSPSPSRKRQHTLDTVTPDTAIDMNCLGFCDPSVHEAMFSDLQSVQQKRKAEGRTGGGIVDSGQTCRPSSQDYKYKVNGTVVRATI